MRFSLKWLLAVMAYVAFAVAAVVSDTSVLVQLLWLITTVGYCYAIIVASISRGKRRAVALGFVTLATANFLTYYFAPSRVPLMSIFRLASYGVSSDGDVYQRVTDGSGRVTGFRSVKSIQRRLPALHAIGTLAAGILGCYLGLLAYRNSGMSIEPIDST